MTSFGQWRAVAAVLLCLAWRSPTTTAQPSLGYNPAQAYCNGTAGGAYVVFSSAPTNYTYNPDDPQTAPVYGVDLLYAASYTGSVAP